MNTQAPGSTADTVAFSPDADRLVGTTQPADAPLGPLDSSNGDASTRFIRPAVAAGLSLPSQGSAPTNYTTAGTAPNTYPKAAA